MFYSTSCDAKTVRRTSWGYTSDMYFDQEHFETNHRSLYDYRFKGYGSNSGFLVFDR